MLKTKTALLASVLAFALSASGAVAAHADTAIVGNQAIDDAFNNTLLTVPQANLEVTVGNSYLPLTVIFHNPSPTFPASVAVTTTGGMLLGLTDGPIGERHNATNVIYPESLMSGLEQYLQPESYNLKLGDSMPNDVMSAAITSYQVTTIDDNNYKVEVLADNSASPDAVAQDGPVFEKVDLTVVLENGLLKSVDSSVAIATQSDFSDAQTQDSTFGFIMNPAQIETDWLKAQTGWKAQAINKSVAGLTTKITKAIAASTAYALSHGVTIADKTKGNASLNTFSPKAKTEVLLNLNNSGAPVAVDYSSTVVDFREMWMNMFATRTYSAKSITYNAKKRVYSLKSGAGHVFKVGLDAKGHITSFSTPAFSDDSSSSPAISQKITYKYSAKPATKWLAVPLESQSLVAEISDLNSGGATRDQGAATYVLTGNSLDAAFTPTGESSPSSQLTFDLSTYPAGALQQVEQLLGITVTTT